MNVAKIQNSLITCRLTYMKATLYEIFRMGDIAAVPPPRMAMEDIPYKEYIIPKVPSHSYFTFMYNVYCNT